MIGLIVAAVGTASRSGADSIRTLTGRRRTGADSFPKQPFELIAHSAAIK